MPHQQNTHSLNEGKINFDDIRIIDYVETVSPSVVQTISDKLNKTYINAMQQSLRNRDESLWGGFQTHGIPSPYIRVDGNIMEVEARPDGTLVQLKLLEELLPHLSQNFKQKVRNTLQMSGCQSCIQFGELVDDQHLADIAEIPYRQHSPENVSSLDLSGLHWIRSDTETTYPNDFYSNVDTFSVVPNRDDGNKDHLRYMGESQTLYDFGHRRAKLPWEQGFVLKPAINAARAEGVVTFRGAGKYINIQEDNAAREKVNAFLRANTLNTENVIIQLYQQPDITVIDCISYMGIPRLFFVWNFQTSQYEFVAGLVTARCNSDVIHGAADDAVFWPIIEK